MHSFLCHFSFGAQGPLHETKEVGKKTTTKKHTLCDRPLVLSLSLSLSLFLSHTQSVGLLKKISFKWWFEGWDGVGWPDFVRESVPDCRRSIRKLPLTTRVCAYSGNTGFASPYRVIPVVFRSEDMEMNTCVRFLSGSRRCVPSCSWPFQLGSARRTPIYWTAFRRTQPAWQRPLISTPPYWASCTSTWTTSIVDRERTGRASVCLRRWTNNTCKAVDLPYIQVSIFVCVCVCVCVCGGWKVGGGGRGVNTLLSIPDWIFGGSFLVWFPRVQKLMGNRSEESSWTLSIELKLK